MLMRQRSLGSTAAVVMAASLCSCANRQYELKLSEYPKLPSARIVDRTRAFILKNERLKERALWGNYGGPGCAGGPPIDAMDELFPHVYGAIPASAVVAVTEWQRSDDGAWRRPADI